MNFSLTSYNTATLKEFVKLYKSLLTRIIGCVVDTVLKQRQVVLSATRRPQVVVRTYKPSRKTSGSITLPMKVTISFNATLKEQMDGPSPPKQPG